MLITTILLNACSPQLGIEQNGSSAEDPTNYSLIRGSKGLNTAFIARSYSGMDPSDALEVRPTNGYITINQDESKNKLDFSVHYDFGTEREESSYTFDLAFKNLKYENTDRIIRLDTSKERGAIIMSELEDSLDFEEVSLKGEMSLTREILFAKIEITGLIKNMPFYLKIDGLSLNKPEPKTRQAIVEYCYFEKFIINNRSSNSVLIDLIPVDQWAFEDITLVLRSGETFERTLPDFQAEQYRAISISEYGNEKRDTILNWTSPGAGLLTTQGKDYYILYNENVGRIEPFYYPIITLEINDDTIRRLSID